LEAKTISILVPDFEKLSEIFSHSPLYSAVGIQDPFWKPTAAILDLHHILPLEAIDTTAIFL
jgi:hypothetical protein